MAMSSSSNLGSVAEINVTPLIDVLLVLLIIFMVIVPALPRGLESSVPQPAKNAEAPSQGPVRLEIRAHAAGAADPAYRVDGNSVPAAELAAALGHRLAMRQDRSLLVDADRALSFDQVAQAIGIARGAGAGPIGIASAADRAPR